MKKEKVLLLGSTGMLGSQNYWNDYNYFEIIRHGRRNIESVDYVADLESLEETTMMLREVGPDVVINLSALANVDQCEELNAAFRANILTAYNLSRAIQFSVKKPFLVHLSTDHVYDSPGFSSEDKICLVNQYASSKLAGELSFQFVEHCILRTNFFCKSTVTKPSITDWLYDALINKSKVNLFNDILFNPISSKNLIKNIFIVIASRQLGTFNLGSSSGMSKADFAFRFASSLGLSFNSPNIISVDEMIKVGAKRPKDMRMDTSKFEVGLGLKLQTLDSEIKEFVKESY